MIDGTVMFLTTNPLEAHGFEHPELLMPPGVDNEVTYLQPLRCVFSEVLAYPLWDEYLILGPHAANRKAVEFAQATKPAYVIWPARMYEVFPSTLRGFAAAGARVVGWFFDDDVRFADYTARWLPYLDCCLTHQRAALAGYIAAGATAFHLLPGANADAYAPQQMPAKYDVSFVGRRFGDRGPWIDELRSRGLSVHAFGYGFSSGFLSTTDVVRVFNASKINLCFSRDYRQNAGLQLKARVFEICMAGGFALCEWTPDLGDYFEVGREVEAFHSVEEASEKARFYLDNESARTAIARAGHQRAINCYREDRLLHDVFVSIGRDRHTQPADHGRPLDAQPPEEVPDKARAAWHADLARGLLLNGAPRGRWGEEARLAIHADSSQSLARRLLLLEALPPSIEREAFSLSERLTVSGPSRVRRRLIRLTSRRSASPSVAPN